MKTVTLNGFLGGIRTRKAALGFDDGAEAVDVRRNKGARRSGEKRAMLRRAEERAKANGVEPVVSYR